MISTMFREGIKMLYGVVEILRKIIFPFLVAMAIFIASFPILGQQISEESTVVSLDFAIAETLFEVLDSPVAMGGVDNFRSWSGGGSVSANLIDIGNLPYPNKELVSTLNVTAILIPLQFAYLEGSLSRIAPVKEFSPYSESSMTSWEKMLEFTKNIGIYVEREHEANLFISDAEEYFRDVRGAYSFVSSPLLIIQFIDESHVRVYGENSLPGTVIDQLGLHNAWNGSSNRWGVSTISISELFNYEAHLIIVDTSHLTGREAIQRGVMTSNIWSQLPSVQNDNFTLLNANFWVFGALPSALRFAESLVEALEEPTTP
ncbi:ABC transporter substrate-binding protein [Halomonas sp. AOP35-4E-18]|uniref:ABC transporter substrate-binding protein n=1 Tax=Halomonas sp. AOP35-4E-18 TaxID=3457686 RepID=UPI00403453D1